MEMDDMTKKWPVNGKFNKPCILSFDFDNPFGLVLFERVETKEGREEQSCDDE